MKNFLLISLNLCLGLGALLAKTPTLSPEIDSLCSVGITIDSSATGMLLTAEPTGTAPFAFEWSTGETTQSVDWELPWTQYCVTVTDASGCQSSACVGNPACAVGIVENPPGHLHAVAYGDGPLSYAWNTGETASSISPNTVGEYCVTITSASGCTGTSCFQYTNACWVDVVLVDTLGTYYLSAVINSNVTSIEWNTGETSPLISPLFNNYYCVTASGNGCLSTDCFLFENGMDSCGIADLTIMATANGSGYELAVQTTAAGPFTYQWDAQNSQAPAIQVSDNGTYCVTVTDANGCFSSTCFTLGCEVQIYQSNWGIDHLNAGTQSSGLVTYAWNTGESTPTISPTFSGNFCVTVTTDYGCTSTDCYDYVGFNTRIAGSINALDSTAALILEGVVELYKLNPGTNTFELTEAIPIENDASGWGHHYDFGNVADGNYIIKVSLDPSSPYFNDFVPTYFGDVALWDEATVTSIPGNSSWHDINLLEDVNFTGGSGEITGTLTLDDGFTQEGDDRNNELENISILLFNNQEQHIRQALTDANGTYSFGSLPFGTYKVMVEIVGQEQAERWVTLTAEHPFFTGADFVLTDNGVLNGLKELTYENLMMVYPNPAKHTLQIALPSAAIGELEVTATLSSLGGQVVQAKSARVSGDKPTMQLEVAGMLPGIYSLKVSTERGTMVQKVVVQ